MRRAGRPRRSRSARAGSSSLISASKPRKSRRGEISNPAARLAGVACMIVALDDVFVVPVPTTIESDRLLPPCPQFFDRRGCARRCNPQACGRDFRMERGRRRRRGTAGLALKAAMSRTRSTKRSAIASSVTAIAMSSRSDRSRSGRTEFRLRRNPQNMRSIALLIPRISQSAAPPCDTPRAGTAPRDRRRGRAAPIAIGRIPPAGRCAASADRFRHRGR